jgi:hypothetical protein
MAAAATTFVLISAQPAAACSCLATAEEELIAQAETVFAGTPISRHDVPTTSTDLLPGPAADWTFAVDEVVKGQVGNPRQDVRANLSSASCGIEFELGRRYWVFGYRRDGLLTTGLCTGTRLADQPLSTTTTQATALPAPPSTTAPPPARPVPGPVRFTG